MGRLQKKRNKFLIDKTACNRYACEKHESINTIKSVCNDSDGTDYTRPWI